MNIKNYKENLQNQKDRIFTDEKTLQLLIEEMAKHPWEDFYTQLSLISPNPTQLIKKENTYMVIPISKEELKKVEIPLVLQENYQDVLLERLEKMENAKFYENFWNENLPLELYDDIENFGKIKEQLNRIFDLVRLSLVEKTLDESNLSFVDILGYKPSIFLQRQWKKFLQEENVVDYLKDKSVFSKVFSQVNEDHLFVVNELEQEWKNYLVEQAKEEIVQEEAVAEQKEEPSKEEAQTTHTNEWGYFSNSELEEQETYNENFVISKEVQEDYWVVDFNEKLEEQIKDYVGKRLTKELLDEIKGLDEKIHLHNAIAGKDPYGTITDEWLGYYKFYFVRIEKGEIKEELRIDIGDGEEVNQKYFEYLYEQISKENAQTKEEIVQEEVVAEQKEEPSKEEAQTTHINEYIKNYFSIPSLAPSLTVRVDEKDYDSSILKEYFKNFEFADGRTLDNFNPFKEDEKAFDLVKLTFFKNQDGEYRVMYNSSNSLMYNSELDSFIQNLDIIIEDLKIKESLEKNTQTKEEIVQEEALVEQKEEPSKEEVQTTHINEKLKLFREIQELKELIKERELDHYYADSFEQSAQITGNIVKLKNELAVKENSYNKIKESLEENVQTIKKNKGVER